MQNIDIRAMTASDTQRIPEAFEAAGWHGKTVTQYRRYREEQAAGIRAVFVAACDGTLAGYVTVVWASGYEPFLELDIPEVSDLNVLFGYRRRGIASALMDAAEQLIGTRSAVSGLVSVCTPTTQAHISCT